MSKKWQSPRCRMSNQPYVEPPPKPAGKRVIPPSPKKQCPACKRHFWVKDNGKWPTHGSYKCSFSYGE